MSNRLQHTIYRYVSAGGDEVFIRRVYQNHLYSNWQKRCKTHKSSTPLKDCECKTFSNSEVKTSVLISSSPSLYSIPSSEYNCFEPNIEDETSKGDYKVYEGGDLLKFFSDAIPKRVSEVCLVNDHYILVKMPDTCWRRNSENECIVIEEDINLENTTFKAAQSNTVEDNDNSLVDENRDSCVFAKYFHPKRNHKVSPCNPLATDNTKQSSFHAVQTSPKYEKQSALFECETEVFDSTTKIVRINRDQGTLKVKPQMIEIKPSTRKFDLCSIKSTKNVEDQHDLPHNDLNEIIEVRENELHERNVPIADIELEKPVKYSPLNGMQSLKTSTSSQVVLEHHGLLKMPMNNEQKLCNQQTVNNQFLIKPINKQKKITTPVRHGLKRGIHTRFLNPFGWLMRSFKNREPTTSRNPMKLSITKQKSTNKNKTKIEKKTKLKPKSKSKPIHAVVYKTYFVRWKQLPSENGKKLQRCRSALF